MTQEPEKRDKESEHLPHIMTREETAVELRERANEGDRGKRGRNGSNSGMMPYVFTIVLVILSVVASMQLGVSKSDFTKNIQALTATVDATKKDIKASQDAVTSAVNNLPNTVTSQVNSALESIRNQVNTIESTANNANQRADEAIRQYNSINSNLQSLTNSVTDLVNKLNTTNTNLAGTDNNINALKVQLTALTVSLTALETRMKALEDKHVTTSGGGGTNSPITVTSRIVNKVFTPDSENTTITFGVKLVLANSEARDLEDIELEVPMEIDTGGDILSWTESLSSWSLAEKSIDGTYAEAILNGNSITLDASDNNKKITINMTIKVEGDIGDIDVSIKDADIEVVDWGYE